MFLLYFCVGKKIKSSGDDICIVDLCPVIRPILTGFFMKLSYAYSTLSDRKTSRIRITISASSRRKSIGSRHGYAVRFRIDYGSWFRIPQL